MTAALAFYFVAIFGDGAQAWLTNGPYQSYQSCDIAMQRYAASYAFGAYEYVPTPETSRCYAK